MSSLVAYRGLQVVDPAPTGDGGLAIQEDLQALVDWNPKSVWSQTADPTVNDDEGDDFFPGSHWLRTNVTPPKLFVCKTATAGAAVWQQILLQVVQDTAPKLGGDLDVNGMAIKSSNNGHILLKPNGSGMVKLQTAQTADFLQFLASNGSTVMSAVDASGHWGIGGVAQTQRGISTIAYTYGTGTHYGMTCVVVPTGGGTTQTNAIYARADTTGGTPATFSDMRGVQIANGTKNGTDTITTQYGLKVDALTSGVTNWAIHTSGGDHTLGDDVLIGTTSVPTGTTGKTLMFGNNVNNPTPASGTAGLFAKGSGTATELYAVDASGNVTLLSPHPAAVVETHAERMEALGLPAAQDPWGFHSERPEEGRSTMVDMAAFCRCVEWLMAQAGKPVQLIHETVRTPVPGTAHAE